MHKNIQTFFRIISMYFLIFLNKKNIILITKSNNKIDVHIESQKTPHRATKSRNSHTRLFILRFNVHYTFLILFLSFFLFYCPSQKAKGKHVGNFYVRIGQMNVFVRDGMSGPSVVFFFIGSRLLSSVLYLRRSLLANKT